MYYFLYLTRYETPRVWIVGLVIFILAYFALMAIGIWFYCKFCRGRRIVDQGNGKTNASANQVMLSQKAIEYDEE